MKRYFMKKNYSNKEVIKYFSWKFNKQSKIETDKIN